MTIGDASAGRLAGLPRPGEILAGKYSVEAVLGVGGMAVVVAARHLELDERVALKILLPKYRQNEEIVARFRREARAAVKIKSEHVAKVHDVGTLEDGAPCLVMEYLEGLDLETLISDQGPVPRERAVDYVLQGCEALAEAHALGIVHRDLKPANLFLSQGADGKPMIKLLDFGISKVGGMALTLKQSSFGTPHYMSPESLRATDQVDLRADIWAVGAILHELISGRPPFDADDLETLQALVKKGKPRTLREDCPNEPSGLEAAILRCLEKDPVKRFANVAELANAIAPFGTPEAQKLAVNVHRVAEATKGRAAVVDPQLERPGTPMATFVPGGTLAAGLSASGVHSALLVPQTPQSLDVLGVETRSSIAIDDDRSDQGAPRGTRAAVAVGVLVAVVLLGGIGVKYSGARASDGSDGKTTGATASAAPNAGNAGDAGSVGNAGAVEAPIVASGASGAAGKPSVAPASSVILKTPPLAREPAITGRPMWQKPIKSDPKGVFDDRK
jgi:eukaryotic-like serine/threonine-protein kinase